MSKNINSYIEQQNLQTEVAILQKKILAFKPCYAKLYIPALMGDSDDFIQVPMPVFLAVSYGDRIIPKGTKVIIQTVAGNYNDIKIIGYYNEPKSFNYITFIRKYINGVENPLPDDYGVYPYDEIKE